MAMIAPSIDSDTVSKAMLDGLISRIRDELRNRILESINPEIEAAIDAALKSFDVAIKGYHEPHELRNTIRVLIERR